MNEVLPGCTVCTDCRRHQADNDVRYLIGMWRLLTGDADRSHLGKISNKVSCIGIFREFDPCREKVMHRWDVD